MRYWFTVAPAQPVVFHYDGAQHTANHRRLQKLLLSILSGKQEADFPKVPDTEANRKRFCNFCVYRSRCNRGVIPGNLAATSDLDEVFVADPGWALEFTLEDVPELAF